MQNVVAICLGFCGVVLFTQLLRTGLLNGASFAALTIGVLAISVAISKLDVLQELSVGNAKVTLSKIEEVRRDVYAKADVVRRMGEELADLVVFNVRTVGRLASDDLDEKMLDARKQVEAVLHDIGSDPKKIEEIVSPINDTILFDLQNELYGFLQEQLLKRVMGPGGSPVLWEHVKEEFEAATKNFDRQRLTERAKQRQLYSPELERHLDRIEKFLKEKEL